MKKSLISTSKYLSLILRHDPQLIGLHLDEHGWASVEELLTKASAAGKDITPGLLFEVVKRNDKKRFAISDDGLRIRANQGHSLAVKLGLDPCEPPLVLYHGTAAKNLVAIRQQGLLPGSRQHVHLSADTETARRVGSRHGQPVVLIIDAATMHKHDFAFFLSENHVWLTKCVPATYIRDKV